MTTAPSRGPPDVVSAVAMTIDESGSCDIDAAMAAIPTATAGVVLRPRKPDVAFTT